MAKPNPHTPMSLLCQIGVFWLIRGKVTELHTFSNNNVLWIPHIFQLVLDLAALLVG